ncbi:MAG: hypothetical protein IBX57_00120 [Gammaproteobacteria bacterium]|nr:hypothetical protein [Gammaproteobacteria bacterium]
MTLDLTKEHDLLFKKLASLRVIPDNLDKMINDTLLCVNQLSIESSEQEITSVVKPILTFQPTYLQWCVFNGDEVYERVPYPAPVDDEYNFILNTFVTVVKSLVQRLNKFAIFKQSEEGTPMEVSIKLLEIKQRTGVVLIKR